MKKLIIIICFWSSSLYGVDISNIEVYIRDHRFHPSVIHVPTGNKIKLVIFNEDDTVEEFESIELKREKIIPPKGKIVINLSPLSPGNYKFFGDFHQETAQGEIIVE